MTKINVLRQNYLLITGSMPCFNRNDGNLIFKQETVDDFQVSKSATHHIKYSTVGLTRILYQAWKGGVSVPLTNQL